MLEEKYTESIKNEIAKGRTFDEILNDVPSKDATEQELNAYFDAGDIAGIGEQSVTNVSLLKVVSLTVVVLSLIIGLIIFPFILNNLLFLFPVLILLGVLLSFFGKKQNRAINQFQTKQGLKAIEKYLTEDSYREKFNRQEKSKFRKFILNVVLFILTPIDFVCDSFISISTLLFPTK